MNCSIGILVVLVGCITSVSAQNTTSKNRLDEVKPGMSEPQLKQIMGDPIRFESYTTVKYNTFDTSVYWRYPDEKVIVVTNHLVERVEHNREQLLTFIQQHASKRNKDGLIIINHGNK